jgi:Flp pilus assembly protein TadD
MPVTTYMQRDPRHDHSFSTPDPALSLELGLPDVCTACHQDRTPEWAAEQAEGWWGERLERPRRERARVVAMARRGDRRAVDRLIAWTRDEPIAAWRGVAAGLLGDWAGESRVLDRLRELASDESGLVRTQVARSLELAGPVAHPTLSAPARDPVRAVRVSAALALGPSLDSTSRARADLQQWLVHGSDQPTGLWTQAGLDLGAGRPREAAAKLSRAIGWDPFSPALHHTLAIASAQVGDAQAALRASERAAELAPEDAEMWRALALARSEAADYPGAEKAFLKALELAPDFARVWKDLALLRSFLEDHEGADRAATRAVELAPRSADAWNAWVEVLIQAGLQEKALWVAEQGSVACPEDATLLRVLERAR